MSTPRASKKPTRVAILDAAIQLFLAHAAARPDEVRLEDVARRAGVSRRSVYVHFGSRTGLLVAMVQHFDEGGILQGLIRDVFDSLTSPGALDAIVRLHAEYSPVAYPVASVLMQGRHRDESLKAAWDDRMEARRNVYRHVIQRLSDDRLLSSDWDVETATDALWAMTSWQVWEQLVIDRGWSKERYLEYLRILIRRALVG